SRALTVIGEQAVNVGAEHSPVRRPGSLAPSSCKASEWTRAVRPFGNAHVHFIAIKRRAVRRRAGYRREPFLTREYCFDVEKSETIDRAGPTFDALGVGDRAPEHLVAAAQTEQQSTSPHMRADVDLQPAGAQDLKIGDRRL